MTSGTKRDSNIAVVWTMGRQEPKVFFSGSIALVVFLDKTMESITDLTRHCEKGLHSITRHVSNLIDDEHV